VRCVWPETTRSRLTVGVALHREDVEREQQAGVRVSRRDQPLARAVDQVLVRVVGRVHVTRHARRDVPKTPCRQNTQFVHHYTGETENESDTHAHLTALFPGLPG